MKRESKNTFTPGVEWDFLQPYFEEFLQYTRSIHVWYSCNIVICGLVDDGINFFFCRSRRGFLYKNLNSMMSHTYGRWLRIVENDSYLYYNYCNIKRFITVGVILLKDV